MRSYIFIGGVKRGFAVVKQLMENGSYPKLAFILQEDDHETEKYSHRLVELLKGICPTKITRKLSEEDYQEIQKYEVDLGIVCGWRTLLELDKLKASFKQGLFAAHDSLLPRYRGFAPTNWAIINGEKECGVSIFKINDRAVDSGDIYYQEAVSILDHDDINSVMAKVTKATITGYVKIIRELGHITPIVQDESKATYTTKRTPEDSRIDWRKSAKEIYNLIRATVTPYPNAFTFLDDEKMYIKKAKVVGHHFDLADQHPGKVIAFHEEGIEVLCGQGCLKIEEVELNGEVNNPAKVIKSITKSLV